MSVNRKFMTWLAPLLLACAPAWADSTSWDGTLYGYMGNSTIDINVAPPVNLNLHQVMKAETAEARFNFKAESEELRIFLRPILLTQIERNANASQHRNEAYLSQWQLRLRPVDTLSVSAGREVLNWGPAQFRSPSSPFYFDNGRSNPMGELSGMDALKLAWTPDVHTALAIARISGSGHTRIAPDPWRNGWLLKWDQRGDDWVTGLALAQAESQGITIGLHGQQSVGDAWLMYAEAGSGERRNANPLLPTTSNRHSDWLLGAAYTFESGQSLHGEFMRYGHGMDTATQRAYFSGMTAAPAGIGAGAAPSLLGRDYLHLVWQSNLLEGDGYARLMATRGLRGGLLEFAGYLEHNFNNRAALFGMASWSNGGVRNEFVSLHILSLTAGLKIALP